MTDLTRLIYGSGSAREPKHAGPRTGRIHKIDGSRRLPWLLAVEGWTA